MNAEIDWHNETIPATTPQTTAEETTRLCLRANKRIRRGQEVTHSYWPHIHTPFVFFHMFGFVLDKAAHAAYTDKEKQCNDLPKFVGWEAGNYQNPIQRNFAFFAHDFCEND